jgi:hypothetical protein
MLLQRSDGTHVSERLTKPGRKLGNDSILEENSTSLLSLKSPFQASHPHSCLLGEAGVQASVGVPAPAAISSNKTSIFRLLLTVSRHSTVINFTILKTKRTRECNSSYSHLAFPSTLSLATWLTESTKHRKQLTETVTAFNFNAIH